MKNKVIAIFDFDGTITKGDTFLPFLLHSFGMWKTIFNFIRSIPYLLAYALNFISNHYAKEKIIDLFFKRFEIEKLKLISEEFVEQKLDDHLKKNMIERLNWHQSQGHITVLISASLNVYVEPWARKYNFSFIESTLLEKHKNSYTGKIKGNNCYGIEKVYRLKNIFKDNLKKYKTYGYGDSSGDRFFIDLCDFKYFKNDLTKL